MKFTTPLIPGRLLRRYKRFLADIEMETGAQITAHCANPGAMLGVADPGSRVWVERNDDPKRKLKYSWKILETGNGHLVGIDTGVPNRVVAEALQAGQIPGLAGEVRAEVRYGANSRVDFLVTAPDGAKIFVEVKNVHLMRRPGLAEFPDSVTKRGAKHLADLSAEVAAGHRAVMLYCVQRTDCDEMGFAGDLDPGYLTAFIDARKSGVEAIAWACRISTAEITLDRPLPIIENSPPDQGRQ
ncbi:DNA/RNA nuclease SfsA [Rhodobacteraceae bacterium NNCM2]|nr:DNA/RNA nuclease SfsA [Coraliihabitans acroporae]